MNPKNGPHSFIDNTSAKTGKGRSTVSRHAKRGKLKEMSDIVGTSLEIESLPYEVPENHSESGFARVPL